EELVVKTRDPMRRAADAKMEYASQDLFLQNLRLLLEKAKCHGIRPAAETPDCLVQARIAIGDNRIEETNFEIAGKLAAQRPHIGCKIIHAMQKALSCSDGECAFLRQSEPPAPAVTKLDSEALLQSGYVIADRRQADVQLGLGGGKTAVADDGIKHAQ